MGATAGAINGQQNFIAGSPMGGMRVLSAPEVARYTSPYYDPYTASRRPNYMPFGPNQQFYQPVYQPSYSQFSPMGYGQAPFGGFYQPPMMGFGQRFGQPQFGSMNFQGGDPGAFRNALMRQSERKGFGQPQRSLNDLGNFDMTGQGIFRNNPMDRHMMPPEMFGPATDISDQGQAALRQMPQQFYQPMMPPPLQQQFRPIPYITQAQIDQRAAAVGGRAPVSGGMDGSGGGFGDGGFGGGTTGDTTGGGYIGPGSVGPEGQNASPGDSPGEGYGVGGDSSSGGWGEGVFKRGGKVRKQSYGGIDSLLRK